MRVLVIGGTRFVGWHVVDRCIRQGHHVTLLNRGVSAPGQWPELERITADRGSPAPAKGRLDRDWDLVIDCCAYSARDLPILRLLSGHVGHYTLISSCAVHDPASASGKRECEHGVASLMPDTPLLVARLGLTIGPRDPTRRLTYWLQQALSGQEPLVPMEPAQPLRLIDVRDVASFVVEAARAGQSGRPDLLGPATTAGTLLAMIGALTGNRIRWRWLPEAQALARGLRPWTQIPLWIPATDTTARALMTREPTAGLRTRPLEQTLTDTLTWYADQER